MAESHPTKCKIICSSTYKIIASTTKATKQPGYKTINLQGITESLPRIDSDRC